MPRPHDRGGWPAQEAINRSEHQLTDWERKTDALGSILAEKGMISVDEMRRAIEDIPPKDYESISYYERWVAAIEAILVEKNILSPVEIEGRAEEIAKSWG